MSMTKKEKVIKGLKTCKKSIEKSLSVCERCAEKLYDDALEVLEGKES